MIQVIAGAFSVLLIIYIVKCAYTILSPDALIESKLNDIDANEARYNKIKNLKVKEVKEKKEKIKNVLDA